jgi:FixJ family two-component response regulator
MRGGRSAIVLGPRGTVLVVEDDDSMREAIERLLKAGGFGCETHAMADSLLERSFDEDLVCVISDLKLSGMSGLDLLGALRARGNSLPFILITGHDASGLRQDALRRGAAAYLAKPFRGTTLLETVRAVIEQRPPP